MSDIIPCNNALPISKDNMSQHNHQLDIFIDHIRHEISEKYQPLVEKLQLQLQLTSIKQQVQETKLKQITEEMRNQLGCPECRKLLYEYTEATTQTIDTDEERALIDLTDMALRLKIPKPPSYRIDQLRSFNSRSSNRID